MTLKIDIRGDIAGLRKGLSEFQQRQVPFATALALTRLAQGVVGVEQGEIDKTFDTPTPFTRNSITMRPATKRNLEALVYPREIAASYLTPYVIGGARSLGGKRGMIVPRAAGVNQYGNLTRNKLATLKGKPNVFVGTVRFKGGGHSISGVWQRGSARPGAKGAKGKAKSARGGPLKLLIQFEDTSEVPRRLPFNEAARRYLSANTKREFDRALREALRTAGG